MTKTLFLSDHFAYSLKCKQSCFVILHNVNGNYQKDMFKSHYNYLQFSYYKRKCVLTAEL